jgi:hypothetical protein
MQNNYVLFEMNQQTIQLAEIIPSEQNVKRQRPAKLRPCNRTAKKPLGVRYAEVLKLRQAVLQTLSAASRSHSDRRP